MAKDFNRTYGITDFKKVTAILKGHSECPRGEPFDFLGLIRGFNKVFGSCLTSQ